MIFPEELEQMEGCAKIPFAAQRKQHGLIFSDIFFAVRTTKSGRLIIDGKQVAKSG
jgi:hypothetical protein